jgi:8-oxo-dGTP diphosphatase
MIMGNPRIVAVGAVLEDSQGRILLVQNRRRGGTHWSLPKGGCEEGEALTETLRREVLEETGLTVDPVEMAFVTEWQVQGRDEWYLQIYFWAQVIAGKAAVQPGDDDVIDVRWVHPSELEKYMGYRPWLQPLQQWLRERRPRYHLF